METKICRKCRNRKPVDSLVKLNSRWFCKDEDNCHWHVSGQPKTIETVSDRLDVIVDVLDNVESQIETLKKDKKIAAQVIEHRQVSKKGVVITSAQNNTLVHLEFFDALLNYCQAKDYELLVIPYTYLKTQETTRIEDPDYDVAYAPILKSYLCPNKIEFGSFIIQADLNLRPTTLNPLSGLESLTMGKSSIFGHPQIAALSLATPAGQQPCLLHTTGAVTHKNYRQQPTGKKAEFHHVFGAIVLEQKDDNTHCRVLNAFDEDGSFVDLGIKYWANGNTTRVKTEALVMGDIHVGSTSKSVLKATDEMLSYFKPEHLVIHDMFDGASINPHEDHNPFAKFHRSFDTVAQEIDANIDFLINYSAKVDRVIVVASNHNDFLYRWLMRSDWRELDKNSASIYLALAQVVITSQSSNAIASILKPSVPENVQFLEIDESYPISKIECGFHGHTGANGGKGSPKTFSKQGFKTITGHVHHRSITRGNMTAGTSTDLVLGYTKGFSNWSHTHVVIYEGGKRQQIQMYDGAWR